MSTSVSLPPSVKRIKFAKLLLWVFGLLVAFGIGAHYRSLVAKEELLLQEENSRVCHDLARHIDTEAIVARQLADTLAQFGKASSGSKEDLERILLNFMQSAPDGLISGAGLWFERGKTSFAGSTALFGPYACRHHEGGKAGVRISYEWSGENHNYPARSWYRLGLSSGTSVAFTEPYSNSGEMYIRATRCFEENPSAPLGVATIDMALGALRSHLSSMSLSENVALRITTRDNKYIFHPNERALIAKARAAGQHTNSLLDIPLEDELKNASKNTTSWAHSTAEVLGWTVWRKVDVAAVPFSKDEKLQGLIISLGILSLVLTLGYLGLDFAERRIGETLHVKMPDEQTKKPNLDRSRQRRRHHLLELVLRRNMSMLKNASEDRDRLLSLLAHDFRGGLMVIRAGVEEANEAYQRGNQFELGQCLHDVEHRLMITSNCCEELIRWVELQRSRKSVKITELSLFEAIAPVRPLLELQAKDKGVQLEFEVSDTFRCMANEGMIQSLTRNLVGNAIKFTPKDGHVRVKAIQETAEPNYVRVEISDTGVGMPDHEAARVFQRRELQSKPGTSGEKGVGLGLMICMEIVRQMGGRIWMISHPGIGSSVSFTLRASSSGMEAIPPAKSQPESRHSIPSQRPFSAQIGWLSHQNSWSPSRHQAG